MATVSAFIRTSQKSISRANVRFRLTDGRSVQLFHTSEIVVDPHDWDAKNHCIKAKVLYDELKRQKFNKSVSNRKELIYDLYNRETFKDNLTSSWLEEAIDKSLHPEKFHKPEEKPKTLFDVFDIFIEEFRGSARTKDHYSSVKRIFQRYELYKSIKRPSFILSFEVLNTHLLRDVESFIKDEYKLFEKHPEIYEAVPDSRPPKERGRNRTSKIFSYFRTFVNWAIEQKLTNINSFPKYKIKGEVYGTPYYLTIEERNSLYNFDLSEHPELAVQRDIFVFHCLVGCRIGDLMKLKKDNIINGAVEYVPGKTKEERPNTIRVPLNKIALEIIEKYKEKDSEKLLPFISEQNYNLDIKKVLALAKINRVVTVINPTTGEEEKKAISEIASSHVARRTFCGNLYKKVKDPNLVGSLSGHKEGSRAFARYRDIDDEMKNDLINLLD